MGVCLKVCVILQMLKRCPGEKKGRRLESERAGWRPAERNRDAALFRARAHHISLPAPTHTHCACMHTPSLFYSASPFSAGGSPHGSSMPCFRLNATRAGASFSATDR